MPIDRRTLEEIEACRAGSDDLQLPELAETCERVDADPQVHAVYARVQRWDTAVSRAMQDVALPQGLAERLLARLAAGNSAALAGMSAALATGENVAGAGEHAEVSPLPCETPGAQGSSRRVWLGLISAVAAAIVVGLGVAQYLQSDVDTPVESLTDAWLAQLNADWATMDKAPQHYIVPAAITAEATGWQRINSRGGFLGVAYRLESPRAGTARLFVVRLSKHGLPSSPPVKPQWTTGGRSIGYWQSGDLTFVLVVEGNEDSYRAFANVSRMPLA